MVGFVIKEAKSMAQEPQQHNQNLTIPISSHPASQSHNSIINPNPTSNLVSSPTDPNQNNESSTIASSSQQMQQLQLNPTPPRAAELQMLNEDLLGVCHPDHKRPFSSLEDARHRLLPYLVLADYEADEDDRILDSDTTGQMLSGSQQWDHNIAAKVSEFTATFENQVLAFNIISCKRACGEFRSEERLMLEQTLLQEERRSLVELRAEIDSRQKAGREAHEANYLRMAAMVHAEEARAEMLARGPIRPNAHGNQGSNIQIGHSMVVDHEQEVNPEETINSWVKNVRRDEKGPSEVFLNDEETEIGDEPDV